MAYLIGEVTKELLETVHEFCEKEELGGMVTSRLK